MQLACSGPPDRSGLASFLPPAPSVPWGPARPQGWAWRWSSGMEEDGAGGPPPQPILVTVPGPVSHAGSLAGAFFFSSEQALLGHLQAAFLLGWEEPCHLQGGEWWCWGIRPGFGGLEVQQRVKLSGWRHRPLHWGANWREGRIQRGALEACLEEEGSTSLHQVPHAVLNYIVSYILRSARGRWASPVHRGGHWSVTSFRVMQQHEGCKARI